MDDIKLLTKNMIKNEGSHTNNKNIQSGIEIEFAIEKWEEGKDK